MNFFSQDNVRVALLCDALSEAITHLVKKIRTLRIRPLSIKHDIQEENNYSPGIIQGLKLLVLCVYFTVVIVLTTDWRNKTS